MRSNTNSLIVQHDVVFKHEHDVVFKHGHSHFSNRILNIHTCTSVYVSSAMRQVKRLKIPRNK